MEPIAAAYQWPLDHMLDLDVDELAEWHALAKARLEVTEKASAAHIATTLARMFGAK